MATRINITIDSDESGKFCAVDKGSGAAAFPGEPFLLAGVVRWNGGLDILAAEDLWKGLGLGHWGNFHASETTKDRRRLLDRAAQSAARGVSEAERGRLEIVAYRFQPRLQLPRDDVYLDLVVHLVLGAVREVVREVVDDTSWSGLAPLRLELNLARRGGLNLRPLEAALERAVGRDLRLSNLARTPGKRRRGFLPRGVNESAIHVHCSVIPAQQSIYLALSDLLCNSLFRGLARGTESATRRTRIVAQQDLLALDDPTWAAIMADDPIGPAAPVPEKSPVSLVDTLVNLGREGGARSVGDLRRAGAWPQMSTSDERSHAIQTLLEEAEAANELHRRLAQAHALGSLAGVLLEDSDWARGIPAEDLERLELDRDSLFLAVANHRGQPHPGRFDRDAANARSARMLGQASNHDAVVHFHNRIAVNAMNRFQFAESTRDAMSFVDLLRTEREGIAALLGGSPPANWHFGALLGTTGQSLALHGYTSRKPAFLEKAINYFLEAGHHFDAEADKRRQCSYAVHAQLDLMRLTEDIDSTAGGLDLLNSMLDYLDADVASFCADPWGPESPRQAFAVHARLKEAWVLGQDLPWAPGLVDSLSRGLTDAPLVHPRQQIAGLLGLLLDLEPSHALAVALKRTGAAGRTLVNVIAQVYVLDIEAGDNESVGAALATVDEQLPGWLRPGWVASGMPGALRRSLEDGTHFIGALPFYYF
jgi:hypothetical protein